MKTYKKIIIILTGIAILVSGIYFKQEFFLMIPLFVSLFVMSFQSEANRLGSLIGAINAVVYTVAYLYMGVYISAASAFFMRFSITHSNSGADAITGINPAQVFIVKAMREDIRDAIYDDARVTTSLRFSASICGFEPIFEKRDAIVLNRCTSLFISATVSASTPRLSISSIHAISDEIGVPS